MIENSTEKTMILEINNILMDLGNNVIKYKSLENNNIDQLKEYKSNIYKSYQAIEMIYLYVSNLLDEKIINNEELDIIDKIINLDI